MKGKILTAIWVSLLLILGLPLSGLIAAKSDNAGRGAKPDKHKPVRATNVELVKKITVRGRPPWAGGGGGKSKKTAATGVLGTAAGEARYAVVVGISDYPGEENDLEYCDDDADQMYEVLTSVSVYGFSNDNVTKLVDMDATRAAILEAIDAIPGDADEIVFFFSGHGMKGTADDGDKEKMDEALVAHDGSDIVPIWDGELRDAFSSFATSRIVFVFDICLAGGMNRDLEAPGRVIAMASTENGYSYETSDLENGEFTYYFAEKGIAGGLANTHDYDGDTHLQEPEQVTIEEAYDYAKANCTLDKPNIGDYFDDDLLP
jgi:hypothetical protein